jgi:hypothetical protein
MGQNSAKDHLFDDPSWLMHHAVRWIVEPLFTQITNKADARELQVRGAV